MKSKVLKSVLSMVIIVALAASMVLSAGAVAANTSWYTTKAGTVNTWNFGEPGISVTLTSSYTNIYPGDVGMWFVEAGAGFPNSYARDTSRTAYVDLVVNNRDVRRYYFNFRVNNGNYWIYSVPYKSDLLVANTTNLGTGKPAQLKMDWRIESNPADTTLNVPAGAWMFAFWID